MRARKNSKALTVVYQIDEHRQRLLWLGDKRRVRTLLKFFRWFGKQRSGALEFICSDMWRPYLKVIAKASHAVHVLDRFHIMSMMSKAIDKVWAEEAKQLHARGYEPVLKGSRWLLLKRPDNLTDSQDVKLAELLQYNLRSARSYLLKRAPSPQLLLRASTTKPNSLPEKPSDSGLSKLPKSPFFTHLEIYRNQK